MADTIKTVLITGAAHRIGRAVAMAMAKTGWSVAVHYNASRDAAFDLCGELEKMGVTAAAFQADLAREDDVQNLVQEATGTLGPLGCLINNASLFENDTFETVTRESWDRHIETNLRAPFVLTQAFAGQLPEGREGNVINLIDQRVWNLTPYFMSYTLSKAGLWTLTQTMALALAPRIRVNAIGPGPTLQSIHQTEEDFRRQWQSMPLARPADPAEIARAVLFILDAPAMTGQMIALDSGQHLGWGHGGGRNPEG